MKKQFAVFIDHEQVATIDVNTNEVVEASVTITLEPTYEHLTTEQIWSGDWIEQEE